MKLTPWFEGDVKPHRIGVYERGMNGCPLPHPFYFWDGQYWRGMGETTVEKIVGQNISVFQKIQWRGLAEPPKKAKAK